MENNVKVKAERETKKFMKDGESGKRNGRWRG